MRKYLLIVLAIASASLFGQTPQAFNYQAIVRTTTGNPIPNKNIKFLLTIRDSTTHANTYQETHIKTTNQFGLATLEVGNGTAVTGSFPTINWGNSHTYYLQTQMDTTAAFTQYIMMGTSQLLSVPYALYAKAASIDTTTPKYYTNFMARLKANISDTGTYLLGRTRAASTYEPKFGTLAVNKGGTGVATLTPYAIVAGGTTSTGPVQQLNTGTSGQLLQSNGSGLVPGWITPTYISGNQAITLSGDVSGSGTTSIPTTLATLSPNPAGTYTTVTVNPKGLVTSGTLLPLGSANQFYAWDKTWKTIDYSYLSNTPSLAGYALNTITITGTNGLTGGGDLTANRTISHGAKTWVDKTTLSGPTVISNLAIDAYGHPTDWTTRGLTTSDINALNLTGGTMTGKLNAFAATLSNAGFNLGVGTTPTTPVNGDLWTTIGGLYARINGSTVGPFSSTTGTLTSITATSPLTGGTITSTGTIGLPTGDLTSADMNFTGNTGAVIGSGTTMTIKKGTLSELTSSVLNITGGTNSVLGTGTTIQVKQAGLGQSGYLSSADWSSFTGKENVLTFSPPLLRSTNIISLPLNSTYLFVGNASNNATGVAMTGDATISNTGLLTLSNSGVANGTYGSPGSSIPSLNIDSKGRITNASNWTLTPAGIGALALTGGTLTGKLNTVASGSLNAGLNLGVGTAPSSPVNGDVWSTASGLYTQVNNATVGPLSSTTGTLTSITATSPLTGGTITTTGTIGLPTGTLTSPDITVGGYVSGPVIGTGTTLTVNKGNLTESTSSVLTITGGTNAVLGTGTSIQVKQAGSSQNGYLNSTDWNTFNTKVTSVGATAPVQSSGGVNPVISMPQATGSVPGYLSAGDWTTFNNKITSIAVTAPIQTTGGLTPNLSIPPATGSTPGYLTTADWTQFTSKWTLSGSNIYYTNGNVGVGTSTITYPFTATSSNATATVYATNTNTSGTGLIAVGNNVTPPSTVASGGSFYGFNYGLYARATDVGTTASTAAGYFYKSSSGTSPYAKLAVEVAATKYSGYGNFTWSSAGKGPGGTKVLMSTITSPEILISDYGTGQLANGKCHITFDSILSNNIEVNDQHPLKAFIQLEGECHGVYVTNKTRWGFDIVELNNGTSNVSFSWSIIANKSDDISNSGTIMSKHVGIRFQKVDDTEEQK